VGIARDREQAKSLIHIPGERLEVGVEGGEAFSKERVQVLAGLPVADVQDPGEVVQTGGRDLHPRHDLFDHLLAQGMLLEVGVHALDAVRHGDPQVLCQGHAYKGITDVDLVA
jgi:hypothetical protein